MASYFGTYSTHQRDHHLTVGVGLEFISGAASSSQLDMIVNLTVHGKNELPIVAHDGLCAGVCAQYPFVRDDNFFFVYKTCSPTPTIARRSWTSTLR